MFEAHPVPQNVTEFEFHLVGDMTIKQFVYLASGIGAAYLTFALFASRVPLIAYPLIVIFAASGAALAFLPIQERPLDHWIGAYFKAIFQPTKRIYKSKLITKEDPLFKTRLQVYLNSKKNPMVAVNLPNNKTKSTPFSFSMTSVQQARPAQPIIATASTPKAPALDANLPIQTQGSMPIQQPIVKQEPTLLGSAPVSTMALPSQPEAARPVTQQAVTTAAPTQQPVQATAPAVVSNPTEHEPSSDELSKTIEVAKQVHVVQQDIKKTEEQINLIRSKAATQDANPKEYLDQFHQLLGELQGLQAKATLLSQQVAILTNEPIKAQPTQAEPAVKPKSIPTITLTSIANVINGIVTDGSGNYLDGAIILAHDKQGIPVRALKTNKLGQFVAATPLNNGIYTITIEKDNFNFDTIEIELTGTILRPILITAKPMPQGVAHG